MQNLRTAAFLLFIFAFENQSQNKKYDKRDSRYAQNQNNSAYFVVCEWSEGGQKTR